MVSFHSTNESSPISSAAARNLAPASQREGARRDSALPVSETCRGQARDVRPLDSQRDLQTPVTTKVAEYVFYLWSMSLRWITWIMQTGGDSLTLKTRMSCAHTLHTHLQLCTAAVRLLGICPCVQGPVIKTYDQDLVAVEETSYSLF